ncbi:MAG: glycosyltransferase [Ruminococcaceae bacterium]|nr:glycosyltransferase [Oscillospiraceae bacterium]
MMLFSIIVPVYKVEDYIEKCVHSLTSQTFKDIEIILVDDGSPDNCPAKCDELAGRDSRIRVIHKENGGLSDARNAGLQVAQGEYVMFVDSDDYIAEDSCANFAQYAVKGYDVLVGEALVEGGECPLKHIECSDVMSGQEYLKKAVSAGKAPMAAWLNVIRREFLIENDIAFKCGILHEDEQFTPRMLIKAKSVVLTGAVFYHYMIREGSITTKKDKRKNATDFYSTCLELEEIYKSIEDIELKTALLDSLSEKYLSLFESGRLYKYGKQYLSKDFLKRNSYRKKTKMKAKLILFSPRIYHLVKVACKKLGI